MSRRTFLAGMLAACAAPAIVRADSLMRIVARNEALIPIEYGGGVIGIEAALAEALRTMRRTVSFDIQHPKWLIRWDIQCGENRLYVDSCSIAEPGAAIFAKHESIVREVLSDHLRYVTLAKPDA